MLDSWRLRRIPQKNSEQIPENQKVTIDSLKKYLSGSNDITFKEVTINKNETLTVCYIEGLVNTNMINETIVKPIVMQSIKNSDITITDIYDTVRNGLIYNITYEISGNLNNCLELILNGNVCIIGNNSQEGILFDVKGFEKRSIQEPSDENVLKGSKDSFIEVLRVNTGLVRRKIKCKDLKIKEIKVGTESKTGIAIIYLDNKVDKKMLEEVTQKIERIKLDNIISPSNFDEEIVNKKDSIFPKLLYTERPDKFCSNINDGKIGVIIDGLPTAYIIPSVLTMFLQAPEDYSFNFVVSSFLRVLRYLCMFLAVFLPAIYIAIMKFHYEIIPVELTMSIVKSKEGVPFTAFLEALFMLIAFEILIEAGMRLPKVIGQTASVVGGLIVGQAAVEAKIVSPFAVIIIAISAISVFVIPDQDFANAIRINRFIMFILGATTGLFGVSIGFIILLYHLCSLESFGVPYMAPFVANNGMNLLKDTIFRNPIPNKEDSK